METSFWSAVSGGSAALSYTPVTSPQLLGWEQKAILGWCLFSYKIHTTALSSLWKHGGSRFTSLAAVQVSLQCSLATDSSSLERGFLLTTFNTQICLTKRCICNIKVHIFSFAISIHPIKLTNAKVIKIKKCLKYRAIFRSTEDWILPSSARTFSALVVPQQETSGGNMANTHPSKTHGSLKSTELFGCSYVLNPFRPPNETPKFGYFDYGLDVVIGLMSTMSLPFFWKPLRLGFFFHLSLPIKGSGFFAIFLGCSREVPCGNMSLKMKIYCS